MSRESLRSYNEGLVPPILVRELERRNALPGWTARAQALRSDWLDSFHRGFTESDWPDALKATNAGIVDAGTNIAEVTRGAGDIIMPISTPGYLRALLDVIGHTLVRPSSDDPEAKMQTSDHHLQKAATKLELLMGMLNETGYVDAANAEDAFGGAVTTATRFLYYHELGHKIIHLVNGAALRPPWLQPEEEEIAEELLADQHALALLALELRNHPELRLQAFAGVSLALSFLAIKEFAGAELEGGRRRIKHAMLRMSRLSYWARLAQKVNGGFSEGDVAGSVWLWETTRRLLGLVGRIPQPMLSLFVQISTRNRDEWRTASTHLIRWCAYGDRESVRSTFRKIRDSAQEQAKSEPIAERVLTVIGYVLDDTAELEPTLGLQSSLQD